MKNQLIVLGERTEEQKNPNLPYIVDHYDYVKGTQLSQYNAGIVPEMLHSISGIVWEDKDQNGIHDEDRPMAGITLKLERLYYQNGYWQQMDEKEDLEAVTDAAGRYSFDGLKAVERKEDQTIVYGYRLKLEELPPQYGVTQFRADRGNNDNSLNEKTGYLEDVEAPFVLADRADSTTPALYIVGGYNVSHGHSKGNMDAGLVPYGAGSIEGIVFDDENGNGIFDKGETVLKGETVYLDYVVAGTQGARNAGDGFEPYNGMAVKTDKNGKFRFKALPIVNEENEPYQYRLRMNKPSDTNFTKVFSLEEGCKQKANVLSAEGGNKDSEVGVSPSLQLAQARAEENYYELRWQLAGQEYEDVCIGYSRQKQTEDDNTHDEIKNDTNNDIMVEDSGSGVKTGDETPILLYLLLLALSVAGMLGTARYAGKRKRNDE